MNTKNSSHKLIHKFISREYNAGFDSGIKHDVSDPLCRDNERKMKLALKDTLYPLVRAYWQGYYDAIHGYMRNDIQYPR